MALLWMLGRAYVYLLRPLTASGLVHIDLTYMNWYARVRGRVVTTSPRTAEMTYAATMAVEWYSVILSVSLSLL